MRFSSHAFRLVGQFGELEFSASHSDFKMCLHNAFIQFLTSNKGKTAHLEMHHHVHGWRQVCYKHVFPIIDSPLLLNFEKLREGVYQTLRDCERWPSEQEQLELRTQLNAKVRAEDAERRRNAFHVV